MMLLSISAASDRCLPTGRGATHQSSACLRLSVHSAELSFKHKSSPSEANAGSTLRDLVLLWMEENSKADDSSRASLLEKAGRVCLWDPSRLWRWQKRNTTGDLNLKTISIILC